jgi:DNA repair exonuclease SbcCD ATPase subunit
VRVLAGIASNFGSYEDLSFDFENLGLAAIGGQTGSGKSTLMDLIVWTLFGTTSKNGLADDIRGWGSDEPTTATVTLDTDQGALLVYRSRGKPSQNDLYWTEAADPDQTPKRGKDLTETQKLLNERIGFDSDLFMLTSFYSQFSDADRFFTAKAKDRREVLERITDLTLPIQLAERASETRKVTKKALESLETQKARLEGQLGSLTAQRDGITRDSERWESQQARLKAEAKQSADNFDKLKAHEMNHHQVKMAELEADIEDEQVFEVAIRDLMEERGKLADTKKAYQKLLPQLSDLKSRLNFAQKDLERQRKLPDVCPECNRAGANPNKEKHLSAAAKVIADLEAELRNRQAEVKVLEDELAGEAEIDNCITRLLKAREDNKHLISAYERTLAAHDARAKSVNIYQDRLKVLETAKNPYSGQSASVEKDLKKTTVEIHAVEMDIASTSAKVTSLTTLYDLSFTWRAELLQASVADLEQMTNDKLEKFFESPFRVAFTLEDSDKLSVEISRNNTQCPFTQLSGGQRKMLTLAFATALMTAAENRAGIQCSLKMFDEPLQWLDSDLRAKAFRLFQDISNDTETVLVIDHNEEFSNLFDRKFVVTLDNSDHSHVSAA